jgi:hypothetical protein
VRAFADIEAQCTYSLAAGSLNSDVIYVSEGGTRVTLRGIAWGDAILASSPSCSGDLALRSSEILRSLGRVLRELLPALSDDADDRTITHTLTLAEAQHGISILSGESVSIFDEGPTGGATLSATAGNVSDGTVWIPHVTRAEITAIDLESAELAASARWQDESDDLKNVGVACPSIVVTGERIGEAVLWLHGVRGSDAASAAEAGATPFAIIPPPFETVLVSHRVPIRVSSRDASPILRAIIEATDYKIENSSAVATVRLLSTLLLPQEAANQSAAFSHVARELAAVLQFNSSTAPPGAGRDSTMDEAGSSYSHDADTLAALIAALEEADALLPVSLGGAVADYKQDEEGLRLGVASSQTTSHNIQWVSHLARHPYFNATHDDEAVLSDFLAYTAPLRLAQKRAAAALSAETVGETLNATL